MFFPARVLSLGHFGRTRGARTSGTVGALLQISYKGVPGEPITSDGIGTNATLLWNCPSI